MNLNIWLCLYVNIYLDKNYMKQVISDVYQDATMVVDYWFTTTIHRIVIKMLFFACISLSSLCKGNKKHFLKVYIKMLIQKTMISKKTNNS